MRGTDETGGIWQHSTKGDLDPDLTEEAGESPADWQTEDTSRRWSLLAMAIIALVAILSPLLMWLA